MTRKFIVTTMVVGLLVAGNQVSAGAIESTVKSVEDGDTLTLSNGERVHLFGIDAPELTQKCERNGKCVPCGEEARDALYSLSAGMLRCETHGKQLGMLIARCFGGGTDLSERVLELGQAVIFRNRLRSGEGLPQIYGYVEAKAKSEGTGIWSGTMIDPWHWRHAGARLSCER